MTKVKTLNFFIFSFLFYSFFFKVSILDAESHLGNDLGLTSIETNNRTEYFKVSLIENEDYDKYDIWEGKKPPFELKDVNDDGRTMVIHMPANQKVKNNKAVLLVPGGGYQNTMIGLPINFGKKLQKEGYEVFVLDYRVAKNNYHYPVQFQEIVRALKWVKSKSDRWNFDAERTGAVGFSAGGHLVSFLATRYDLKPYENLDEIDELSPRPAYHGLVYPVISFDAEISHNGSVVNFTGMKIPSDEQRDFFSNELHVSVKTPEAFIVHSWEDELVKAENSLRYFQALRKNEIKSALHLFESGPHGVGLGKPDMDFSFWPIMMIFWMNNK